MEKAKKVVIGFFIIAILVIAGLYLIYNAKADGKTITPGYDNQTLLFYSLTCPHCKIVEAFINENNITKKVNITQLEVSQDSANAKKLIETGNSCKIEQTLIGAVPLLYSEGKCYLGDTPIIEFLNKTVNKS